MRYTTERHLAIWAVIVMAAIVNDTAAAGESRNEGDALRPNIVFVICDDLRYDTFGFMNYPHVQTPNIDKLAAEGVRFTNAFVNIAICGPSRISFWTGKYPGAHRGPDFLKTLEQAGYQTREVGKMHGTGGKACFVKYNGERRHQSEVNYLETEVFLRQRDQDRPFCLRLGYVCTHAPFQPASDTNDLYRAVRFANPKTRTSEYFDTLPEILRTNLNVTRYKKVFPPSQGDEPFQRFVRNYLRCVTTIDRSVGKVMELLDRFKLTDNTIVVFTSDHGFFLGEHGYGGKWTAHEPSMRIPLIIRDPRLTRERQGLSVDNCALNVDLCPTVLDFAGVQSAVDLHGRSLRPLLAGTTLPDWRKDFYYRFDWGHAQIPQCEAVRTDRFKYVAYWPNKTGDQQRPVVEQLFDLLQDSDESQNLTHDPAKTELMTKLRSRCKELRTLYGGARKKAKP